jgi:hypothetical protein
MTNPFSSSHPLVLPRARRVPRRRGRGLASALVRAAFVPGAAAGCGGAPALPAREVQARLVLLDLLPATGVTGRYDRATLDAVARFQAARGLTVDGVPGARTADLLLDAV